MTINNFNIIRDFLSFNEDDFYFVQIIKRRKDNPDMKRGEATIKNYYINSFDEYDKLIPVITNQCIYENARAYFRLNKRNYKDLSLKVMNRGLVYVAANQHKALRNVFDAVAGEHHSDPVRKWLVDVDKDEFECLDDYDERCRDVGELLTELQKLTKNEPMLELVYTKNGTHFITRPFNLKVFKEHYTEMDVHKDATTLLYCP